MTYTPPRLRLLALAASLALTACGGAVKKTCKDTGCSAGSVCNTNTGARELTPGTGGGSAAGGGGGGSATGGGGGAVVDPFNDGGTFVPGDICSFPFPVAFDGGVVASVSVDLSTFDDQYNSDCNSTTSTAPDVLFAVTLPEPKGLDVTVAGANDAGVDTVISLYASPCALTAELQCSDSTSSTTPERLTIDRLPAGTYYVLVETYGSSATPGPVDVRFELTAPPPAPMNDACANAQVITLTGTAGTATGTTTGAFSDNVLAPLSCSSGSRAGGDVYYSFTTTATLDVTVSVDAATGSDLSPAIALADSCGGMERGCDTGFPATVTRRSLPAGTYYVTVDGTDEFRGAFTLDVTTAPPTPLPTNDTCASPATLAPSASVTVDVTSATKDYTNSCAMRASGGDVVYQFTLAQAQFVRLTATSTNGADGILGVRTSCADAASEQACADSSGSMDPELFQGNLAAGTYFVILQAYGTSAGAFGLALDLLPPVPAPANESCTAPQVVTLTGGSGSAMADLRGAAADVSNDCFIASDGGGDVVYQVEVPAMQTLTVVVTPDMALDPVVSITATSCAAMTTDDCQDNGGSGDPETASYVNTTAAPVTVFVALKAYATGGTASLTFTAAP